jgi:translation initiation factor IF-2
LELVLAKATKKAGVRVNQLAQELSVESKDILSKLRSEGLDWAPNHMSTLTMGQAETVRDWVNSGEIARSESGGGSAVATAEAPPEGLGKPKAPRRKPTKKSVVDETVETPSSEADESAAPTVKAPVAEAPAVETPAATATPVEAEAPAAPPAVKIKHHPKKEEAPAPPEAPAAPSAPQAPALAAEAPAPAAPTTPPPAKPAVVAPEHARPVSRPTITLANRAGAVPHAPERRPVTPAPQLNRPAPASIQGPRVVREEKPDPMPAPRPRRPMGGPNLDGPSITQARPQAGRGVRTDDEGDDDKKKGAANKKGTSSLSNRRRGPDGRRGEAMEKLKEYTEADLIERRDRLNAAASYRTGFDSHLKKSSERGTHAIAKTGVQKGEPIEIEEPITVKSLSATLGIKSNDILKKLMSQGVFASVNQALDTETAQAIALDYGIELTIAVEQTMQEELLAEFEAGTKTENLVPRPPVVTILGHVDHGKTSLLDKIRSANVAAGEAGGITQHTAAWMVTIGEGESAKKVTFIDTPGHHAFTRMRARGANMTDVVVLVIGAVEGVMPQTVESINHARAAGVPIVVALNKIDRPDANPDMVLGQLAGNNLNPVEWGGDTEVIRTSAVTGQGVKELLENLDYQAELLELKADPTAPARGSVIESRVDPGLGSVATVLVQDGTLKVGDVILSGPGYGRIRSLLNDLGKPIQEAGPSTPVIVSGLDQLPDAGDKFFVVEDIDRARSIAEERATLARQNQLAGQNKVTLDNLFATIKEGEIKTINLIIKGDVQGSVETLTQTVTDQNTDEVRVRVIHSAVGAISESDVELADASDAVIIGFNVVPDEAARAMAEQRRVEIRTYRVIYEIFDDLKKALSGMLEPEIREKLHGHVEIRQVFKVSRMGNIAGCFVTDGHVQRGSKIRLIRNGAIVTEDLSIESLKRLKDDVKEVKAGFECGIKLAGYDDIKVGDVLEAYVRETIQRTL